MMFYVGLAVSARSFLQRERSAAKSDILACQADQWNAAGNMTRIIVVVNAFTIWKKTLATMI